MTERNVFPEISGNFQWRNDAMPDIAMPPNPFDLALSGNMKKAGDGEKDPSEFLKARAEGLLALLEKSEDGLVRRNDIPDLLRILDIWRMEETTFSICYVFRAKECCSRKAGRAIDELHRFIACAKGEPVKGISTSPDLLPPVTETDGEFLDTLLDSVRKARELWGPWVESVRDGKTLPAHYTDTFTAVQWPFPGKKAPCQNAVSG